MENIIEIVTASSATIAFLVAIVVGLVEVIKKTLVENTRYAPILSLVIAIGLTVLTLGSEFTVATKIILGILVGLTASGLYSSTKTVVG